MAIHFLKSQMDKNLSHITDVIVEGATFILSAASEKPPLENRTEDSGTVILLLWIPDGG